MNQTASANVHKKASLAPHIDSKMDEIRARIETVLAGIPRASATLIPTDILHDQEAREIGDRDTLMFTEVRVKLPTGAEYTLGALTEADRPWQRGGSYAVCDRPNAFYVKAKEPRYGIIMEGTKTLTVKNFDSAESNFLAVIRHAIKTTCEEVA